MKKTALAIIVLVIFFGRTYSTERYEWVKKFGDSGDDYSGRCVVTDPSGNVYFWGTYTGKLIIGSDTIENTNVTSPKPYFAKLDSNGNGLWVKNFIGCYPITTARVDDRHLFVGSGDVKGISTGFPPQFCVSKYDTNGNYVWDIQVGPGSTTGMVMDSGQSIYVTANFNPYSVGFYSMVGVADSAGQDVWGVNFGNGTNELYSEAICLDSIGNILIAGYYKYQLRLIDSLGTQPIILNASGINDYNLFVAKYSSSGMLLEAYQDTINIPNLASQGTGEVKFKFDSKKNLYVYCSNGTLLKYDSNLNLKWKQSYPDLVMVAGYLAWDISDDARFILLGYSYNAPCFFNTTGNLKFFLIDSSGNTVLEKQYPVGCSSTASTQGPGNGLHVDANKNIYIGGEFFGTQVYDSQSLISNSSSTDVFVAKINLCNNDLPVITENNGVLICTNAGTYQWYLNGDLIVGANAQQYTPTINGVYTVNINEQTICSAISSQYSFTAVSVADAGLLRVSVYPNPVTMNMLINAPNNSEVVVYDLQGQPIKSFQNVTTYLDVSELPPAMYIAEVITDVGKGRVRFIKQ